MLQIQARTFFLAALLLAGAVNVLDFCRRPKPNAVSGIPIQWVQKDVGGVLRTVQDIRQQYSIVVAIRLIAEHGDVKLLAATPRDYLFDDTRLGAVMHRMELGPANALKHKNLGVRERRVRAALSQWSLVQALAGDFQSQELKIPRGGLNT